MNAILARVVQKIWLLAVASLVMVAVVVSLGRVMLPRLHQYQESIQTYLSSALNAPVTFDHLAGDWQDLQPVIFIDNLKIRSPDTKTSLALGSLVLRLNVIGSVLQGQPVFGSIQLDDVELRLEQNDEGRWTFAGKSGTASKQGDKGGPDLMALLLAQRQVQLSNIQLTLDFKDGRQKQLHVPLWELNCAGEVCASEGKASFEGGSKKQLVFALNLKGRPGEKKFQLDAFAEWQPLPIDEWLPLTGVKLPVSFNLDTFMLGGRVWLSMADNQLRDVRGQLHVPELAFATDGREIAPVQNIGSEFVWKQNRGEQQDLWSLWLNNFTFQWEGETFEPAKLQCTLSQEGENRAIRLVADAIDLEFTSNTLLSIEDLPEKLQAVLKTLEPKGRLVNAHFQYRLDNEAQGTPEQDRLPLFQLEANLNEVAVSPWKNAPGGSGVNGYLKVTPRGGMVDLETENFELYFPKLYSTQWQYDRARGIVSWQNQGRSVWLQGENLRLEGRSGKIDGQFSLLAPKDGTEPRLNLMIGLEDAQVKEALVYVPDKKVSPALVNWLDQSIRQAHVERAAFLYSGSVIRGAPAIARSMRLDVKAAQIELAYLKGWPALTEAAAEVTLVDAQAHVTAESGKLLNSEIQNLVADFIPDKSGGVVTVKSKLSGPTGDGLQILQDTPLRDVLFDLVDDFQVAGEMELDLDLGIPLKKQSPLRTRIGLVTDNSALSIPSLNLNFEDIQGRFSYSEARGLNAKKVKAAFFGQPVIADIGSEIIPPTGVERQRQQTRIQMAGEVTTDALYEWLPQPLFTRFEGKAAYRAEMNFGAREGNGIVILSDLAGVEVALPEPFGKPKEEQRALTMIVSLDHEPKHFLSYGDQLQFALQFEDGAYNQGEIRIGGDQALFEDIPGIRFVGSTTMLDVAQWQKLFRDIEEAAANAMTTGQYRDDQPDLDEDQTRFLELLSQVRLKADSLLFAGQTLDNVLIDAEQIAGDWLVQLENPVVKGRILAFQDVTKPLAIELEYLRLDEANGDEGDPMSEVVPQDLIEVDFRTREFSIGKDNYGSWSFKLTPGKQGVTVTDIDASVKGLRLLGDLDWLYADGKHVTEFSGQVGSSDAGDALEAWGYSRSLEGEEARLAGDLSWSGSPAMFSLIDSTGELEIKGKEGRFIEVESSANVLRLFGILNFTSLARRLRLDFSDLFKKGYSFDKLKGRLALDRGQVTFVDSLVIDGPSAKFKIDGRTDMINQQFDQELIVVLPVSDNIPIAATIVGAPQVGIPLYLLNKVFGNMFERFTSARYRVTGSWDDPKIELVKIFENRTSGKAGEAQTQTGQEAGAENQASGTEGATE